MTAYVSYHAYYALVLAEHFSLVATRGVPTPGSLTIHRDIPLGWGHSPYMGDMSPFIEVSPYMEIPPYMGYPLIGRQVSNFFT